MGSEWPGGGSGRGPAGRRWRMGAGAAGPALLAAALGLAVLLGSRAGQPPSTQTTPTVSPTARQILAAVATQTPTPLPTSAASTARTPAPTVSSTATAQAGTTEGPAAGTPLAETTAVAPGTPTPQPARPLAATAYVVQEGDTLSHIAERFGIAADAILWANNGVDNPDFLSVGQQLVVPPVTGILHTVLLGDTLSDIAATYRTSLAAIIEANALVEPYLISVGQLLVVPGGTPPEPQPQPVSIASAERAEPPSRGEPAQRTQALPAPATTASQAPAPAPSPTVVPHPQLSAQGAAFIADLLAPAQRSRAETGVPVSVTLAQAILETNWGQSGLARQANNLFGIKGRPLPGPAGVVWMDTWEHVNGRDITVKEPFRAYHNIEESVLDHGRYLRDNKRYAEAMRNVDDPRLFIRLIHQAGYATDPAYADKVIRIMDRYNLYVYD